MFHRVAKHLRRQPLAISGVALAIVGIVVTIVLWSHSTDTTDRQFAETNRQVSEVGTVLENVAAGVAEQAAEVGMKREDLRQQEALLAADKAGVEQERQETAAARTEVEQREAEVARERANVERREAEVARLRVDLDQQALDLEADQEAIVAASREVEQEASEVARERADVERREAEVARERADVEQQEADLALAEAGIEQREVAVQAARNAVERQRATFESGLKYLNSKVGSHLPGLTVSNGWRVLTHLEGLEERAQQSIVEQFAAQGPAETDLVLRRLARLSSAGYRRVLVQIAEGEWDRLLPLYTSADVALLAGMARLESADLYVLLAEFLNSKATDVAQLWQLGRLTPAERERLLTRLNEVREVDRARLTLYTPADLEALVQLGRVNVADRDRLLAQLEPVARVEPEWDHLVALFAQLEPAYWDPLLSVRASTK